MNTILLEGAPKGGLGDFGMPIMMALIFVVMYFFMIRPQKKKEKELAKKRESIKKDDKVITAGGIHGTVTSVDEETVVIAIESQAKLRIEKASVSIINGEGTGAAKK